MGNGRQWCFGVLVTGLLAAFAWWVLRPHEPFYQGKPLSQWLNRREPRRQYYFSEILSPEGEQAVRGLGPKALPLLVRMASTPMTIPNLIVGGMAADESFAFLHLPPQRLKPELAVQGFRVLGPAAKPAVPALIQLLRSRHLDVQICAARCLAGLGPDAAEAVPALIEVLRGKASGNRGFPFYRPYEPPQDYAAMALGDIGPAAAAALPYLMRMTNDMAQLAEIRIKGESFASFFEPLTNTSNPTAWCRRAVLVGRLGTNADPAIPWLVAALDSTNYYIKNRAIVALGQLHLRPELCVVSLTNLLNSRNSALQINCLTALGRFEAAAWPAVPGIVGCLQASEPGIRLEATNALRRIDPHALAGTNATRQ